MSSPPPVSADVPGEGRIPGDDRPPRWYETAWFRKAWVVTAVLTAVVEGGYAVFKRTNDYEVYLRFGRDFLEGEPYRSVGNFYPLARCAFQGVIASVPRSLGKALVYIAALATLWLVWRVWDRLAASETENREQGRLPFGQRFAAGALAGAALFPFVLRDLDECGLQLLCLGMLTAAGAAMHAGRAWATGVWLAAAISFRVTPLLFLPLLVWKREWKAAGATVVCLLAWNLAPALYLGPTEAVRQNVAWATHVTAVLGDSPDAYPSPRGIEEPKHQNVGLRAALARLLETYPPGHALHLDHPAFVQFGDLDKRTAGRAVLGAVLLMGAAVAWRMRRRWARGGERSLRSGLTEPPTFARDWAVGCLFAALLSPVCWKHHTVLALPVVYLAGRRVVAGGESRGRLVAFWAAAGAIWVGRKFLLGDELALLWLSYNVDTLALLTFGALTLYGGGAGSSVDGVKAEAPRGLGFDGAPPLRRAA